MNVNRYCGESKDNRESHGVKKYTDIAEDKRQFACCCSWQTKIRFPDNAIFTSSLFQSQEIYFKNLFPSWLSLLDKHEKTEQFMLYGVSKVDMLPQR